MKNARSSIESNIFNVLELFRKLEKQHLNFDSGRKSQNFVFFISLLIICAITGYTGVAPIHKFGHDIFFLLDNSWRVLNGQCPQVDYSSAWGPVTFVIYALGLKISNFSVNGIGYINAILGFIIGLWSYSLGCDRLQYPFRFLFSLFMVGLVVAPYALSYGIINTTYAMVYNRYGYALLGLILLESMQPVQNHNKLSSEWMDGVSTGAAVALTFFLKVSYFFASLLLIVGISIILKRFGLKRIFGVLVGFTLVTAAFLYYLKFDIQSIYNELSMAASARSESLDYNMFFKKFFLNVVHLPIIMVFVFTGSMAADKKPFQREKIPFVLIGALLFVTDVFLIFTNQQWYELPLIASFVLIVVNSVTATNNFGYSRKFGFPNSTYVVWLVFGAALFLPIFMFQYFALTHAVLEKINPPEIKNIHRFTQYTLKDLLLYEGEASMSNGRQYTTYINEGVSLLLAASNKSEKVLTVDMFNPFPFALGRIPPTGGIAAAAYKYTLSDNHRPSNDRYFGNSDIVMVPKKPAGGEYFRGVMKIYEIGLMEKYSLVTQSDWWYLYRRKK